jgi:hypothetical protein
MHQRQLLLWHLLLLYLLQLLRLELPDMPYRKAQVPMVLPLV